MANMILGSCPDSWGIWYPNDPHNIRWTQFLDEVTEAGYRAIELGALGYLPLDPDVLIPELEKRGLTLTATTTIGSAIVSDFWTDGFLRSLPPLLEMQAKLGARYMVMIPGLFVDGFCPDVLLPREISQEQWGRFVQHIEMLGKLTASYGVTLLVHPHAETYLTHAPEIEKLLEMTDPQYVSICLDTGHFAYGGVDINAFIKKYKDRVPYLHIKNCDKEILEQMHREGWSYQKAVDQGLMCCPPERGLVDYASLKQTLEEINYDGYVIVEESIYPAPPEKAFELGKNTFRYLKSIGIG